LEKIKMIKPFGIVGDERKAKLTYLLLLDSFKQMS
jgi:hypothetical protein